MPFHVGPVCESEGDNREKKGKKEKDYEKLALLYTMLSHDQVQTKATVSVNRRE